MIAAVGRCPQEIDGAAARRLYRVHVENVALDVAGMREQCRMSCQSHRIMVVGYMNGQASILQPCARATQTGKQDDVYASVQSSLHGGQCRPLHAATSGHAKSSYA